MDAWPALKKELQMNRAGQRRTQREDGYTLFKSGRWNAVLFLTWILIWSRSIFIVFCPSLLSFYHLHVPLFSVSVFLSFSCRRSFTEVIEGNLCAAEECLTGTMSGDFMCSQAALHHRDRKLSCLQCAKVSLLFYNVKVFFFF